MLFHTAQKREACLKAFGAVVGIRKGQLQLDPVEQEVCRVKSRCGHLASTALLPLFSPTMRSQVTALLAWLKMDNRGAALTTRMDGQELAQLDWILGVGHETMP